MGSPASCLCRTATCCPLPPSHPAPLPVSPGSSLDVGQPLRRVLPTPCSCTGFSGTFGYHFEPPFSQLTGQVADLGLRPRRASDLRVPRPAATWVSEQMRLGLGQTPVAARAGGTGSWKPPAATSLSASPCPLPQMLMLRARLAHKVSMTALRAPGEPKTVHLGEESRAGQL